MFTLIGGGMKTLEDSFMPMKDVLPGLAKWLKDSVSEFDPAQNLVRTKNGDTIEYDQMLVATGLELKYDQIPGVVEALSIPNGNVCSNYSPEYVNRTYKALEKFQSGNAIFTFPNSPVKCPGAPQKIMYIAEHYLRRVGRNSIFNRGGSPTHTEILISPAIPDQEASEGEHYLQHLVACDFRRQALCGRALENRQEARHLH